MKTLAPDFCARRGNILTKLFIFACALAATFALMWMLLLPSIVTGLIKKRTGFDATVQRLYVNPFTASVYISQLVVKLDKIIIADYSGAEPKVHEIPLTINRTFTDVTDLKQISVPLLADLSTAGAGKLANNILGLVIPAPILEQLGVVGKD